ncbi:cytochrome P450 [Hyaloraphidium curvatum]|nr:cytochrome P450 [Hyaloraphidium curvatum]
MLAQILLSPWVFIPLAAVAAVLWFWPNTIVGSRRRTDVPVAPGAVPLLGHLLAMKKIAPRRNDFLATAARDLGEVVRQTFWSPVTGFADVFLLTNVADVEAVYRNPWDFPKGKFGPVVGRELLGHGIFASDGDHWKFQRKLASNIFNVKNFKDLFGPVFERDGKDIVRHLSQAAETGAAIDLQDLFLRATVDTFATCAMGMQLGALDVDYALVDSVDAAGNVYKSYKLPDVEFAQAFDDATQIVASRMGDPFWKTNELKDGRRTRLDHALGVINTFAKTVIANKRQNGVKQGREGDILDMFLSQRDDEGKELDDEFLRDTVLNFLVAGRDTTAQTLSWVFWKLAQHPDVLHQVREEVLQVVGREGEIPYDALKDLRYCNAVWNETLRLHPNVPVQFRQSVKDCVLPGTGTRLYKDDITMLSSYAMGRQTRIWGPDAEEFRPARWLDEKGGLVKTNQFQWPAFSAGPRICLGMQMATQEALVFLCSIVRRFDLQVVNEDHPSKYGVPETKEGRYIFGISLGMRGGLEVVPKKI